MLLEVEVAHPEKKMVVLLRMPSLDRAGPKNGEPYGVWQFKRTATMYCCMQWGRTAFAMG